jgi:ribA/ribD-fused uncharacterized protein
MIVELSHLKIEKENNMDEIVTDTHIFFWGGIYSNWYISPFSIGGRDYNCVEQYMMASKAYIFNDIFTFEKIMLEKSPSKQKKLGRQVKNFDSKYWDKICIPIITNGVTEKFRQNKHLLNELLSTGNKKFVEASPYDKIWGIGLGMDNPDIYEESKWDGKNYLGICLDNARQNLINYKEVN